MKIQLENIAIYQNDLAKMFEHYVLTKTLEDDVDTLELQSLAITCQDLRAHLEDLQKARFVYMEGRNSQQD